MPIPAGQSCSNCAYMSDSRCLRRAPESTSTMATWPQVAPNFWCGEHTTVHTGDDTMYSTLTTLLTAIDDTLQAGINVTIV